MKTLKISITEQQKIRLTAFNEATGLSYAEIFRRAFDYFFETIEAKHPSA